MKAKAGTISLTVDDVEASSTFFTRHLGYRQQMAADGFCSLAADGEAMDLVLLRRGIEVLPPEQRDQHASGVILAYTVDDLEGELARLQAEGVEITLPLQEEEWGERLFQVRDPNGISVELVEWNADAGPESWAGDQSPDEAGSR